MAEGAGPVQFASAANQFVSGAQGGAPSVGVGGGNSTGGGVLLAAPNTFNVGRGPDNFLPEFLGKLTAPLVEARKRDMFFQGFSKARSGKALEEIQEETPWMQRIFGNTNYEQGATVYRGQAAVAEIGRELQENMHELRKLTPEQMGEWLSAKSANALTGDVIADATIQKGLMDVVGPIMETQAKARFAFQQDEIANAQYDNQLSQARLFDGGMAQLWSMGNTDGPDREPVLRAQQERLRQFEEGFQVPNGQTPESYFGFTERWFEGAAREGLWHSVNAARNSPRYSMLPAELKEKIEKRLTTAESRWRSNLEGSPELEEAYQIRAMGAAGIYSPNELYGRMSEFNGKFKARTGADVPYFDGSEMQSAIVGNAGLVFKAHQSQLDRAHAMQMRAADAEAKAAAEAFTYAGYAQMAGAGTLGIASNQHHFDRTLADQSLAALVAQDVKMGVMAVKANFRNPQVSFVSNQLVDQIATRVNAGAGFAMNDSIRGAHELWTEMFYSKEPDGTDAGFGPAMAQAYFKDNNDKMFRFDQLKKSGLNEEDAYMKVFGAEAQIGAGDLRGGQGNRVNEEALATVLGNSVAVGDGLNTNASWWTRFGADKPTAPTQRLVAHHASRYYEQLLATSPHLEPAAMAQRSVEMATQNGLEIAGSRYAWQNPPGMPRISDSLNVPPDSFGSIFDAAVTNRMRKQGLRVDDKTNFEIIRIADDIAGPRMLIQGMDTTGAMKTVTLGASDFNEAKALHAAGMLETERNLNSRRRFGGAPNPGELRRMMNPNEE